jgi:hypothetical protein
MRHSTESACSHLLSDMIQLSMEAAKGRKYYSRLTQLYRGTQEVTLDVWPSAPDTSKRVAAAMGTALWKGFMGPLEEGTSPSACIISTPETESF